MANEAKSIIYDCTLDIEAYSFIGIEQPFPNHFHNYYVIGAVESGCRTLCCNGITCLIKSNDIVIFNPNDNHGCESAGKESFIYKGLNISEQTMKKAVQEITGETFCPLFSANIINSNEIYSSFLKLHNMITQKSDAFEKEELFFFLISALLEDYSDKKGTDDDYLININNICEYLEMNYYDKITLESMCRQFSISKSTLLRSFLKQRGVTPYRYLQSIRIEKSKAMLRQGLSPADTAQKTGFSDQSHFTNCFSSFLGITPSVYAGIYKEKTNDKK